MLKKLLLAHTHWLQEATTTTTSSSSGAAAAAAAAAAHRLLAERCVSHTQATSSSTQQQQQPRAAPKSSSQQQQQQQQPLPPPQPELVDRVLSPDLMSRRQLLQHRKADLIRSFQRFPGDTGSTEVQVALLTDKIRDMMEHARLHRKDQSSKRGLQGMLNHRRALLAYLRRTDFAAFAATIHRLGLRDNVYARQARYDRFRVGSRLGVPAEPIKAYGKR